MANNIILQESDLEQLIYCVVRKSWYEECEQADQEIANRSIISEMVTMATGSDSSSTTAVPTDDKSFTVTKDVSNSSSYCGKDYPTSSGLMEKRKIKVTFKRCLSLTSDSQSTTELKRQSRMAANAATESASCIGKDYDLENAIREPRDISPDSSSERSIGSACKRAVIFETDQSILDRRQKQIDYGKNTIGYDEYVKQIPKDKRLAEHPWTPQKNLKYSRRAFDGLVNVWRKKLHWYDPSNMNFGRFKNENA